MRAEELKGRNGGAPKTAYRLRCINHPSKHRASVHTMTNIHRGSHTRFFDCTDSVIERDTLRAIVLATKRGDINEILRGVATALCKTRIEMHIVGMLERLSSKM